MILNQVKKNKTAQVKCSLGQPIKNGIMERIIIATVIILISVLGYGQKETKEISEKNLSGFSNYVKIYYKETKNIEKGTIIKYNDIYFRDERYKAIKSMEDLVILDEETKIKFIDDINAHIFRIENKSDSDYKTTQVIYSIDTYKNSKDIFITSNISNGYFSLSVKNAKKLIEFLNASIVGK